MLWREVERGGWAPTGGRSLPVSVTYANHAAFATGASPADTGIHGNWAWVDGEGWRRAPDVGPLAETIFDSARARGVHATAVLGDHKLVPQMGATAADVCWPDKGDHEPETPRCLLGYATDQAVIDALRSRWPTGLPPAEGELIVVHLNEPDTTAHIFGPDSEQALEQYRRTDEALGQIVALAETAWDDTVLIVVSDHDQEPITVREPVDLEAAFPHLDVAHDGTAALIHGTVTDAEVLTIEGVEGLEALGGDCSMAWTLPGHHFGTTDSGAQGQHGSPRCRTQVAVVSGGHGAVPALAEQIAEHPPSATDWAPAVRSLLGLGGS